MRIDLPASDAWNALNERCRISLPFQDPAVQVQAYAGFQHALYEATQGLARLFSHKKTIAIIHPAEPAIEAIGTAFAEEAYTVKTFSPAELVDPTAWLTPLLSDLIFVVLAIDDPVTGRVYDIAKLDEALKEKRVFRVYLSHAHHESFPLARPANYEVRILSLRPDLAVLAAGERFRVSPVLAPKLAWSATEISPLQQTQGNKSAIQSFEKSLPSGFKSYFKDEEARLFDRAVIYHPEMDGLAVVSELARSLGINQESTLDTASPCRWNNPRMLDWLLGRGEAEEVVRGMIVIDHSIVNDRLAPALSVAAEKTRKLQGN